MKKYLLLSLLLNSGIASAQWIQSLTVSPANPTVNDNITVYADVLFNSGPCHDKSQNQSVIGNSIYSYAIHCLGPLAFICNDIDTFNIGMLPAGNYQFIYAVDNGMSPSPCTPGIVPGPSDTLDFTVSSITSIENKADEPFSAFFTGHLLQIDIKYTGDNMLHIYNSTGSEVSTLHNLNGVHQLSFSGYREGIYFITLQHGNNFTSKKIFYGKK